MSESRTLVKEKGIGARAWRGKGGFYNEERQIPMSRGRESKTSPGEVGIFLLLHKSGQTQNGKGCWETKGLLIK